tara:strand:+ start:461 stop:577 length:117 start_codon:yes stop_codon:yes gene_type:complete
MDLVDFSQKLYKRLKEREDDIILTLTTGAVLIMNSISS